MNQIIRLYLEESDKIRENHKKFELFDIYFNSKKNKDLQNLIYFDSKYLYKQTRKYIVMFTRNVDNIEYDIFMNAVAAYIKSIKSYDSKYSYKQLCRKLIFDIDLAVKTEVVNNKLSGVHINTSQFFTMYRAFVHKDKKAINTIEKHGWFKILWRNAKEDRFTDKDHMNQYMLSVNVNTESIENNLSNEMYDLYKLSEVISNFSDEEIKLLENRKNEKGAKQLDLFKSNLTFKDIKNKLKKEMRLYK